MDIPFLCLTISLLVVLAIWLAVSFNPNTFLSTAMEPRALVVSVVCLSLARVIWFALDLVSSRLRADPRPPASNAFVHPIPVVRKVEGCKLAPSLSPTQSSRCTSVNDRLAHVFAHHYLGLSQRASPSGSRPKPFALKYRVFPDRSYPPTLARRASTWLPNSGTTMVVP